MKHLHGLSFSSLMKRDIMAACNRFFSDGSGLKEPCGHFVDTKDL